jgi:hypothetical protein
MADEPTTKSTYDSFLDLSIGAHPPDEIDDPVLHRELVDIHDALEKLAEAFTNIGDSGPPPEPPEPGDHQHYHDNLLERDTNIGHPEFAGPGTTHFVPDPVTDKKYNLRSDGEWALPTAGFEDKPASEPIFLVFTGQSNAGGVYPPTAPIVQNLNVYDWNSNGDGSQG